MAPAPVTRGFILACALGAWLAAWLADLFAFRVRARFEAIVPSFVLLLFGAMLGTERHRIGLTAAYLGAILAFVVLADAGARTTTGAWFGTRGAQGDGAVLRAAAVVGLVAVLAGVVVGPRLPGADSPSLFGIGDKPGARGAARVTVSPLVDIRGRLVNPSGAEVFTVGSPSPAYWRLTSLDRFDGSIWSSRGSYQRAKGSLPDGVVTNGPQQPLPQDFVIGALSAIWLPAAFRPDRVEGEVPGLRYERDSGSLLTDRESADGLAYRVESAVPTFTAEGLAAAPDGMPQAIAERYLTLPPDFPVSVRLQAGEVVVGQDTPFAKARALQDWFRSEFTYSLDVPPGHGDDAIVAVPREPGGVLRAVRRLLRGHGPRRRAPVPGGGGLHAGGGGGRRPLPRHRPGGPRLARGLRHRLRVGGVRAHARPGPAGGGGLHRRGPGRGGDAGHARHHRPRGRHPGAGSHHAHPRPRRPARGRRGRRARPVGGQPPGPRHPRAAVAPAGGRRRRRSPSPAGSSADGAGWPPPRRPSGCWWRGTRRRRTWPSPGWASSDGRRRPSTRPGSAPSAATPWPATWASSPSTPSRRPGRARASRPRWPCGRRRTPAALGTALRAEATPRQRATWALDPRPLLRQLAARRRRGGR